MRFIARCLPTGTVVSGTRCRGPSVVCGLLSRSSTWLRTQQCYISIFYQLFKDNYIFLLTEASTNASAFSAVISLPS